MERITTVATGQRIAWHGQAGLMEVQPPCGKDNGYWYCVTHAETFANQMQKDSHISDYSGRKRHQLAWICSQHGAEVP